MNKFKCIKPSISNRYGYVKTDCYLISKEDKRFKPMGINSIGCNSGEDNIVSYVYEILFIYNSYRKAPYVSCDYVQ